VLIVIAVAFLTLIITVKVTDELVTSLEASVRSTLKLYVPTRLKSIVEIVNYVVGLQVSHETHAPEATFLML
jgi:hypothetical protein